MKTNKTQEENKTLAGTATLGLVDKEAMNYVAYITHHIRKGIRECHRGKGTK